MTYSMNLTTLTNVAIIAAKSAGEIIKASSSQHTDVLYKEGGTSYASQIFTEVDKACERTIVSHLLPTCQRYDIALLTEESEGDGSRFRKDYFWCVDPLDGTLAFINKYPGFSVSIALVAKDGSPIIGVVYDPSRGMVYHAIAGQGVYKNGKLWQIKNTNTHMTYVTDRKLSATPNSDKIDTVLKRQLAKTATNTVEEMSGAGAVLNAIRVLENGPACMIKLPKGEQGGGSLWDFAATACIYRELGLQATNYHGGPLDLNRTDSTFMNHEGVLYINP